MFYFDWKRFAVVVLPVVLISGVAAAVLSIPSLPGDGGMWVVVGEVPVYFPATQPSEQQ
jgi:hypothetical protein